MNSHPCTLVQSQLPLHAGGELEPDDSAPIAEHLASCAECSALFSALQRQRARLADAQCAVPQDAPSVWPAVRAALEREGRFAPRATVSSPAASVSEAGLEQRTGPVTSSSAASRRAPVPASASISLATDSAAPSRPALPRAWRAWSALSACAAALLAFALLRPDERPAPGGFDSLAVELPAPAPGAALAVNEPAAAPAALGGLRRLAPSEPTLAELPAGADFAPSLLPVDPAHAGATLATDRRLR
jgi:hypothetical protein